MGRGQSVLRVPALHLRCYRYNCRGDYMEPLGPDERVDHLIFVLILLFLFVILFSFLRFVSE